MNSLTITGQLGKDSERRALGDGTPVLSFSIADGYTQGGEKHTIWWNCAIFGKRADSLQQYLTKGQSVTVIGSVTEKEWTDKEGMKRKDMSVRVNDIALQGGKRDAAPSAAPRQNNAPARQPAARSAGSSGFDDMDDDIPFLFNMNTVSDTIGTSKALLRCKYGKGLHILQVNRPDF